jgi:AcrR family transcriptional regulator
MSTADTPPTPAARKRSDVRRNERKLLDAAAAVFVRTGIDAPVREIAAESGLGMGTIYRHFPTRADLVVAVFRHQLDALSAVAPTEPAGSTRADVRAYDFMLGIGNLCIGVGTFPDYRAHDMIDLLLDGLAQAAPPPTGNEPT